MGKKILLIIILIISCIGGYGLVFGGNLIFTPEIQYVGSSSSKIYMDSTDLTSTVLIYRSNVDISTSKIISSCAIKDVFIESYKSLYFFRVDFSESSSCNNGNIVLEYDGSKIISSLTKLELKNYITDLEVFLDYGSQDLNNFLIELEDDIQKYGVYKNYNGQSVAKNYTYLKGQRRFKEAEYRHKIISYILEGRKHKYISPVPGRTVSEHPSKVPNAARPYRQTYTDGIHHGWDIDGDYGDEVIALDDGIIVRVIENFDVSDFARINYSEDLTYEQKLQNLDILRGKQVWLKTLKGEVVFFSHLDTINTNIKPGVHVQRGEKLGTTGVTGVPQDGYDDYHLHFSIMKNPYALENAGTYNIGDYMKWDWQTKGMSHGEVIEVQKNIFE